jgi:DNA polymerase-1
VLEGLKVPVLERQNYEADDIIATLCKTLGDNGCDLIVVSSDKDLMQLVSHRIKLLDGARNRWIGAEEVKFRFGVEPGQVVQVIGLMGDPVDNIPGVKGIGAKTAVALIRQFGTLENLFDRLNDIEESDLRNAARVRKFLDEGKDAAFLSRELATVRCDVPIAIELDQLRFTGFDQDKLRSLFNELEFTNLIKLLDHGRV